MVTSHARTRLSGRIRRRARIIVVVVALLTASAGVAQAAASGGSEGARPEGGANTTLRGVATISPADAWAVGYIGDVFGSPRPLIRHWNGTKWATDTSLHIPGGLGGLRAVTALSSTDVWAAGWDTQGGYNGLVAHYDGSSWSVVDAASAPNEVFSSIDADSGSDVWVGADDQDGSSGAFAEHFDGVSWNPFTVPGGGYIRSVSVSSPSDAWLFGFRGARQTTLAIHWDGSSLTQVTTANPAPHQNYFSAATGTSPNDLWAAGSYGGKDQISDGPLGEKIRPLAEHWDGTSWSQVKTPRGGIFMTFAGASAVSSNDVWAVGYSGTGYLAEHWDGTSWSLAKTPAPPTGRDEAILWAVSADSSSDAWAVGVSEDDTTFLPYAVILHWDGTHWTRN